MKETIFSWLATTATAVVAVVLWYLLVLALLTLIKPERILPQ